MSFFSLFMAKLRALFHNACLTAATRYLPDLSDMWELRFAKFKKSKALFLMLLLLPAISLKMETTSFMRLLHSAAMSCFYVFIFCNKMYNLLFSLCCFPHWIQSRTLPLPMFTSNYNTHSLVFCEPSCPWCFPQHSPAETGHPVHPRISNLEISV